MNCRGPAGLPDPNDTRALRSEEIMLASRGVGDGKWQTELSVPTIHCGGCIRQIEAALAAHHSVERARVNLSTKRVTITWREGTQAPPFTEILDGIGYPSHLASETGNDEKDVVVIALLRALAVAGFAASNIMLLSVSVWAGAEPEARDMFHLVSAAIAFPALIYSGRPFFSSAWNAVRNGYSNMDVPISVGVLLTFGLSLYETFHHAPEAYFDASISLLFFLLIGRTLDHLMRERVRTAIKGLARLVPRGALVLHADGPAAYVAIDEIQPGDMIVLAAGQRVPVDSRVVTGKSEIDRSLVTGETEPHTAAPGTTLQAGILNVTEPLTVLATASSANSFLAEMMRMMETAETGRSKYCRVADRAAQLFAPAVHGIALLTFAAWMIAGFDLHRAVTIAIAVLIVTCPCALGLAVPMVQIIAARRLFEEGILLKDGAALERLAEIDTVVFDKTGTLTVGKPLVESFDEINPGSIGIAVALAAHSRHPYSLALSSYLGAHDGFSPGTFEMVTETPGFGLLGQHGSHIYRLGRSDWALDGSEPPAEAKAYSVVLSRDGKMIAHFSFQQSLREETARTIDELRGIGLELEILSGDQNEPVQKIAQRLHIPYLARVSPSEKRARIVAIEASGRKTLMVGDGLNDAPALLAAYASMAPATAADVGRNAADLVFLHDSLIAVPDAVRIARSAARLVRQNLLMAISYNAIAVPVAVCGYLTPLFASVAMSTSSVLVVANALRLVRGRTKILKSEARGTQPPTLSRAVGDVR